MTQGPGGPTLLMGGIPTRLHCSQELPCPGLWGAAQPPGGAQAAQGLFRAQASQEGVLSTPGPAVLRLF